MIGLNLLYSNTKVFCEINLAINLAWLFPNLFIVLFSAVLSHRGPAAEAYKQIVLWVSHSINDIFLFHTASTDVLKMHVS